MNTPIAPSHAEKGSSETTPPDFIVGAYASLPFDRRDQETYYSLLATQKWINGLEIPFPGDLSESLPWLSRQIADHWNANTITAIPGTMVNVGKNPAFGLASADEDGRASALKFTNRICKSVQELADRTGRSVMKYIQLHSAPTRAAHSDAFARSLDEIATWNWSGARIVIEHCDAPREDHEPERGFLELADECTIAAEHDVKVHINWGRSCLENRDAATPLQHITLARDKGVLAGVMFSGAGDKDTQYGYPWVDGHLPAYPDEPTSWMTPDQVRQCTQAALGTPGVYFGAKVCVPSESSLNERLAMLKNIRDAALGE